jgi:hypothetical protein
MGASRDPGQGKKRTQSRFAGTGRLFHAQAYPLEQAYPLDKDHWIEGFLN